MGRVAVGRSRRLVGWLCHILVLALVVTLAPPAGLAPAAAQEGELGTPPAPAGRGPVERPLPPDAVPNHGYPEGERRPPVPPGVTAAGPARQPTPAERVRTATAQRRAESILAEAGTAQVTSVASDLLLRPGFLLGDTSLVVYFDGELDEGDPSSFGEWWATVTDVESEEEQQSVTLGQADVSRCQVPRLLCRSFGAADGWELDPERDYTVTITVVQADGSEATSEPSNEARPRETVVPPAVPAAQAVGCGCPTVLGQTTVPQAVRGARVNTATGAFLRVERDLVMSSYGIPFNATRFYSSANLAVGMFGSGWSWTYDARVLAFSDDAVRVRAEDGSEAVFTRAADGSFTAPAGIRSQLSEVGDGWLLVTPDQRRLTFGESGRLESVTNARGHGVTLAYDPNTGLLSTITDVSGRVVQVEHRADLRLLTKLTLPDGRSIQYDYQDGRLLKVQDPRGFTHSYGYDEAGRLAQVTDARGQPQVRNTYDPATGRVVAQLDPLGAQTTFGWDATTQEAITVDPDGVVIFDGYVDNVLVYSQNGNNDTVNHRYDPGLRKNLVVDPKGSQEETAHDAAGNPVQRTAPAPFSFTEANVFDEQNNLTAHTDGRGNTWTADFNQFNEMTGQADPEQDDGYQYEYDDLGLLVQRTDPRGMVTSFEYDQHGNRTADVSPTGRRVEFTYDLTGRMTSIVDPRGTVPGANPDEFRTRFVYDQASNVIEVWQPGKPAPFRTRYDELGSVHVQTDPLGGNTIFTYDTASRVVQVESPKGDLTATTYTPGGRQASVTDGEGNTTSWTYDAMGRLATEISPRGNADPDNAELFITTFHYDFNGNLVRADRPFGTGGARVQVDTAFDQLDRPSVQADELGATTTVSYDNAGNVVGMTNEHGEQLGYTYDAANRRTGGSGVATAAEIEYDQAGNPVRQVTPTGGVVTWEYDDDGRPVAITEPRGNLPGADPEEFTTRYAYDQAGSPETVTDPLGNVTTFTYDANDRLVAESDANGNTTRFGYDPLDRLTSVTGPDSPGGQALRYTYDANSQVIERIDPLGRRAAMEYDRAGRLVVSTDPLGRRREYVYDPDSNLVELVTARVVEGDPRVDPNRPARTIFFAYDNLGRLTSKQLGTDGLVYNYGYDAKNRLVSLADPVGVEQRVYDNTDRLVQVNRGGDTFSYEYDLNDNITARTYPDGTRIEATFDEGDRPTSLTASRGGSSASYQIAYDVSDNPVSITFPEATGVVEDREYDPAGRLTAITSQAGGQVLAGYELTLDPVGNPTQVVTTRGGPDQPTASEVVAYAFDEADRLVSACYGAQTCDGPSAERIDYTYDLVGNRTQQHVVAPGVDTTTSYTYDAADQLLQETVTGTTSSVRTFVYDLEGNQIRAGDNLYEYHLDNTLASATIDGQTTSYDYDGSGQRIAATTGDGPGQVTQTWRWDINAGLPLLASETVSASGSTQSRSFLYDPGGAPLALLEPVGAVQQVHSYLRDWLGGVGGMVGPDGTPQWAYDYDPFGLPRGEDLVDGGQQLVEDAPDNPFQFAGAYRDTSQGERYQLRARNYDPGTGRFDAQDPLAPDAADPAISTYAYANNRPTVLTDPSGLRPDAGYGDWRRQCPYCGDQDAADQGTGSTTDDDEMVDNPEYYSAKELVDEAEAAIKKIGDEIINLILDLVGFNDAKACITEGDIVGCISTALQLVPWGKLFKAAKVLVKAVGVGKRLVEAYSQLRTARTALAQIPKRIKKAGNAAGEANDSRRYTTQVRNATTNAKNTGNQAKDTAKNARNAKRTNERGSSCPVGRANSFASGTLVVMADGTAQPIEDLQPGDTVLATDPGTGQTEPEQVVATITSTGTKQLVDLTLVGAGAGGGGPPGQTITTTDEHPFWTHERGWVTAEHLQPGEHLRDLDGTLIPLAAVTIDTATTTVYNLTVNNTHTYYVQTTDGTAALNHNTDLRRQAGSAACGDGFDDLRNKTQQYRERNGLPVAGSPADARTVAVFEYTTPNGRLRTIAVENIPRNIRPGGLHAEIRGSRVLSERGIDPLSVTRIYADRPFCPVCLGHVGKRFTNAVRGSG